ncbi:MAG: helix-turn-helix domain-containing protein [Candidatus Aquicultor sp.]
MRYLTLDQVAETLQVSKRSIYRWIEKRILPAIKLEGSYRISEEDLNRFLEERRV